LALSGKHVVNGNSAADTTAVNTVNTHSHVCAWVLRVFLDAPFLFGGGVPMRQHKTSTCAD